MPPYLYLLIYVLAALAVGYLGRRTVAGPIVSFVAALLVTPAVAFVLLILFARQLPRRSG